MMMLLKQIIWHTGAAPGVSTAIDAALEDGIRIIMLTNADSKAEAIENIIYKAAEKPSAPEIFHFPHHRLYVVPAYYQAMLV